MILCFFKNQFWKFFPMKLIKLEKNLVDYNLFKQTYNMSL